MRAIRVCYITVCIAAAAAAAAAAWGGSVMFIENR